MRPYRIQGIPDTIATAARESLKSPQYGHPVHAEMATGYGPCRLCLQTFQVSTDERLLFTYQPFTDPARCPRPARGSSIVGDANGTTALNCRRRSAPFR